MVLHLHKRAGLSPRVKRGDSRMDFRWAGIVLGGIVALLGGLWVVVPNLFGLPWIPTHRKRIRSALQLANVQPGERVYDLGAGDGRTLIVAAREFGAQAVGIEIEPVHCVIARLWAVIGGVASRVSVRWGDLYRADFRDADVVLFYLTPGHAERLKPLLERQLSPGARVVSLVVDLEGWQPAAVDTDDLLFLYHMPPARGSVHAFLTQQHALHTENRDAARSSSRTVADAREGRAGSL
jgi:SAM-dependent methyltransferase